MAQELELLATELMVGAYDLHVHSAPSPFPREQDGMELIRDANAAGMGGILLKSHYEPTASRATLINWHSGCKTKAYGGLVLNWPCGGLNIYAVDNALKTGAKIIWMPTRDSMNSLSFGNMEGDFFTRKGITILDEKGDLKQSVYEIMDAVRGAGACLATGHLSPKESMCLCKAGCAMGVRMILTHPELPSTKIDAQTQKEMADLGVLIEKNWYNVVHNGVSIKEMAATIRLVGSSRVYIATDRGQRGQPPAVSEYRRFILALLQAGLNENELRDLTQKVPGSIVD